MTAPLADVFRKCTPSTEVICSILVVSLLGEVWVGEERGIFWRLRPRLGQSYVERDEEQVRNPWAVELHYTVRREIS